MRPLHLRLIAADPGVPELAAVTAQLRAAGHLVTTSDQEAIPAPFPPIPDLVLTEGMAAGGGESLEAAEARHIQAVLRFTGGNKRQAALLLGVARSTLLAKIRRYRL